MTMDSNNLSGGFLFVFHVLTSTESLRILLVGARHYALVTQTQFLIYFSYQACEDKNYPHFIDEEIKAERREILSPC